MARRSPAQWVVLWVSLLLAVDLSKGQEEKPFGETCLEDFTAGMPDFVLDTDASVQNGATFLSSPMVHRSRDCVRACCKDPACNLALVEQVPGTEDDHIQGCFLLNCLYEQAFVCRFARKIGFVNFLRKDVYDSYQTMQNHGSSDVKTLVERCPLLVHLDLRELGEIPTLKTLQVFGIVTDSSLQLLRETLPDMKINCSHFTSIARPTVGSKKNHEIWGIKCRLTLRNPSGL